MAIYNIPVVFNEGKFRCSDTGSNYLNENFILNLELMEDVYLFIKL